MVTIIYRPGLSAGPSGELNDRRLGQPIAPGGLPQLDMKYLPNMLTVSRIVIAVLLVVDARDGNASGYFFPLFLYAGLTDFLDGVVARRLKAESSLGCLLDGYADVVFYVSAFICLYWWLYPVQARQYGWGIAAVIVFQLASWGFSLAKFGRLTSYHSYSAKVWGICVFAAAAAVFGWGSFRLFPLMIAAGIISNIDEIIITARLRQWRSEVKGWWVVHS